MITIQQKDNGEDGTFFAMDSDREVAKMSYYWDNDDLIVIDHTKVSNPYQNQGLGKNLVAKCVDFARKENIWIDPQCQFARHVFDQTPEFGDVFYK